MISFWWKLLSLLRLFRLLLLSLVLNYVIKLLHAKYRFVKIGYKSITVSFQMEIFNQSRTFRINTPHNISFYVYALKIFLYAMFQKSSCLLRGL